MTGLPSFPVACFDRVFYPYTNAFVPDLKPVWGRRVLQPGGRLTAGLTNPMAYLFGVFAPDEGEPKVARAISSRT